MGVGSTVDDAIELGRRGWPVFPLDGKRPVHKGWKRRASADETAIRAAWKANPKANIGVKTGDGFYVLDADSSEGVQYLESLGLARTLRVRTGRGEHFYVRTDQTIANAAGVTIAAGVDGRGDGGYVLGVGSTHPELDTAYEWIDANAPLLDMPAELGERLAARSTSSDDELTTEALAGFAAAAQRLSVTERAELTAEASRAVTQVRAALGALPTEEGNGRGAKFFGHAQTLGEYVGAGVLGLDEARSTLVEAGVMLCCGHAHGRSIERGLTAGTAKPAEPELADFGPSSLLHMNGDVQSRPNGSEKASSSSLGSTSYYDGPKSEASSQVPGVGVATSDVSARWANRRVDIDAELSKPVKPKPWRCVGFAQDGALTITTGKGGTGKSWVLLGLAHAVTTGETVAGIECKQGPAILIDGEMGRVQIVERIRGAGITKDCLLYDATGLDFSKPDDLGWLRFVITEHTDGTGGFVGIDSLRRLTPSKRENDSDDMAPVISSLATLARQLNVAIVLLHHEGWESGRLRGSSAILDQADAVFSLSRLHPSDDPTGELRKLSCRGAGGKMRFAREPDDIFLTVGDDGRVTTDRPVSKTDEYTAKIVACLPQKSKTAAAKACGSSRSTDAWRDAWDELESSGSIEQAAGQWVVQTTVEEPAI